MIHSWIQLCIFILYIYILYIKQYKEEMWLGGICLSSTSQNVKRTVEAPGPSDASDPSDRAHH
jgi:hypothetical protein